MKQGQINLLPWREELAEERKKHLGILLGVAVAVGFGLSFSWGLAVNQSLDDHKDRNKLIKKRIATLDEKIIQIEDLKSKRESLVARMTVIQDLQGKRPVIVREFDSLVQTLPEDLYYKRLDKKDDTLFIVGMAKSNPKISQLMRNLDESEWFEKPTLSKVEQTNKSDDTYSEFRLKVNRQLSEKEIEARRLNELEEQRKKEEEGRK